MDSPSKLPVIAIFSLAIIFGSLFALDSFGIVATPLSLENGEGRFFGTNTSEKNLKFAQSYIETKLIYSDSIKTSRTDSVINNFTPFSLISSKDTTLNPLIRAELFVYTDYSNMGTDVIFDFPRTTVKQFVTVNGIPVNVYKQLLLENSYNKETKLLKGTGIAITPDFFETIINQGTTLKSGDIIEVIMTVEGRYDVADIDPNGNIIKYYDGWIKGLNTSVVFIYYDPTELLLIRSGQTSPLPEGTQTGGCVDANANGICDVNDPTMITVQTTNPETNSVSTDTSVETPPESQTSVSVSAGEPIFNNVIPEEPVELPDSNELSTIYTSENAVTGSSGVTVACSENVTNCEEVVDTIVSTIQEKRESDSFSIYWIIGLIVSVIILVVYLVIKKVKNR